LNSILEDLQRYGTTGDGGTERLAFSQEDLDARNYLSDLMLYAEMTVTTDLCGNLVARRLGTEPEALPIILGSHIDTVPQGGSYDGQVGSAGAVEVALSLLEQDVSLRHPLEILIFVNEEGGKTGSRALAGRVEPFELDILTASGFTIAEGINRVGGNASRLADARRMPGGMVGFFELHIEQGAILDRQAIDIGVVQGIVGIRRWNVRVVGFANHAGTTPMDQRRDALVSMSVLVQAVHRIASETAGTQVATVGRIEAVPGAPNVVPGEVLATLEIRDLAMEKISSVFEEIEREAQRIAQRDGVSITFESFYESLAAPTDPGLRSLIDTAAEDLGLTRLTMPSGAGHDAQSMAELGPVGMIFVPSRDGISHSPLEYSSPESIARGADVLLNVVLALDR